MVSKSTVKNNNTLKKYNSDVITCDVITHDRV